jgi:hypothetical protein
VGDESKRRAPVLDPIERVSEVIFGILMAVTFTGSLSVATTGRQEIETMMLTALGCNIAWGLTDAVMYLVGTLTDRHRKVAMLRRIQTTPDHARPGSSPSAHCRCVARSARGECL